MSCKNIFKKEEKNTINNLISKIRALNSVESSSNDTHHHDTNADSNIKTESSITKFLNSVMGNSNKSDSDTDRHYDSHTDSESDRHTDSDNNSQTDISAFMKKNKASPFLRHVTPDSQTNLSSFIRNTDSDTPYLKHVTSDTESEKDLPNPNGVLVRKDSPDKDVSVKEPKQLETEDVPTEDVSVTTPEPLKVINQNVSKLSNKNEAHQELNNAICECVTNCRKCLLISCNNNMPECVKTAHDCKIILSQYINISNCCHLCYLVYILNMCILACTKCFRECVKHAEHHEICKLCAESCANVNKKILNYMRIIKNKMPVKQNKRIINKPEHSSDISDHKDDSTEELKQYLINLSKQKQAKKSGTSCSQKHKSNALRYY